MGSLEISFDDRSFREGVDKLNKKVAETAIKAVGDIGMEVLRLSQLEVPHDKGTLQNSGETHIEEDYAVVGYNTPYAHRLHEHPEYHFQKGRKGKFLEDPMKNNLGVFHDFFDKRMGEVTGAI
jgi:hypothetical protein